MIRSVDIKKWMSTLCFEGGLSLHRRYELNKRVRRSVMR